MANPVDLKQFFDFSDTTPIQRVIDLTTQLNTFYDALVDTAKRSSADVTASMQTIQKSIESLEQTMIDADVTTKKGQETVAKGAQQAATFVDQNEASKKAIKELEDQIKLLIEQQEKLSSSKEKFKDKTVAEAGSLAELKKQLKDATDYYNGLGKATDSAVKEDTLKRIGELGKAVKDGNQALQDAKKSTDVAAGSYNELAARVAAATKQLKALEGGVGSAGKEFKDLQDFVSKGNLELKNFDSILGNNQRRVGGYREEIELLLPSLGRFEPVAQAAGEASAGLGEKLLLFVESPIAIGIAAVGAGLATLSALFETGKFAVEKYFEGSIEGTDKANKISAIYSATVEVLKDKFEDLGKKIVDVFTDPKVIQNGLGASLIALFPTLSGLALALGKQTGLIDDIIERYRIAKELADTENAIKKEEILLVTELAKLEKEKNDALFDSRDKLIKSDQDRFEAATKVKQIIQDEVDIQLKAVDAEIVAQRLLLEKRGAKLATEQTSQDIIRGTVAIQKASYDDVQKLAELEARRINIQAELSQGQRRTQQVINTLVDENVKKQQSAEKEIIAAYQQTNQARLKETIDVNTRIIGNQEFTVAEQLEAQRKLTKALIQQTALSADAQTEVARDEAIKRVKLSSDELEAIAKASNGNLKKQVELTIAAYNEKFAADQGYIEKSKAIQEAQSVDEEKIKRDDIQKKAKIYIDGYTYFLGLHEKFLKEDRQAELRDVTKQYTEGKISLYDYTQAKLKILSGYDDKDRNMQIQYYADSIQELKNYIKNTVGLNEGLRDAVLKVVADLENKQGALYEQGAAKRAAKIQKILQQIRTIETQFYERAITTALQFNQNQQDIINSQIQQLTDQSTKEQQLAGDNSKAKELIAQKYTKKIEDEQKKLRKLQHEQAVYERDLAAVKIAIDIAQGIAGLYRDFPYPVALGLSIALGALGTVEEIAVLSKPIPAYEKGRKGGRAEWAVVAEAGPEMVVEPSGKATLYDTEGATLTYLKAGSSVLTAKETQKVMESTVFNNSLNSPPPVIVREPIVVVHSDPKLLAAVQANKPYNIERHGLEIVQVHQDRQGNRKLIRSKIGNFR